MKRLKQFLAWVGFMILILPALPHNGDAQVPRLTIALPIKKVEQWRNEIFPYAQPPIYDDWWHEIAECEGLQLPPDYNLVQFYGVNADSFTPMAWPLVSVYAVTYAKEGQLFMAQPLIWSAHVVKHEMLHWLLFRNGFNFGPWHPAEFYDVCGMAPWGK